MKKHHVFALAMLMAVSSAADAKRVKPNLSVIDVPEEGGVKFERITDNSDCVNSQNLVSKAKGFLGIKNL